MAKYRKKPVVIEAFQYDQSAHDRFWSSEDHMDEFPEWLQERRLGSFYVSNGVPVVLTLEGALSVSIGDWIICGIQGEIYPCKPDIFEATYDPL